jgi:diadenosine tetraphosphatase ApaH/serine/threonine PP2A family protein phosphatase
MGDYVDRGHYSLNTFLLLAIYKITHPQQFFRLHGNHDSRQVTQQYGFQSEIQLKYGHAGLWTKCMKVFDLLPVAAVIDGDIFSVHGGLSPQLIFYGELLDMDRKKELPEIGILADLTWSDPSDVRSVNWSPNSRGAGYIYGQQAVCKFCHRNKLKRITRSHQIAQEGYQWYFSDDDCPGEGKLLLVWSAPNYCYTSGNKASVLRLRFEGKNEFDIPTFEDVPKGERIQPEDVKPHPEYFA